MILLVGLLANNSVDDGLQDVFLGQNALHVLNELVSLVDLVVLEVVDHKVETGLGNDIDQGREDLESIFSTSEDDQVVTEEVVVLEEGA